MPVSYIPSDKQLVERQKTTARKRRRNQNTEIEELGELLPVVPVQTRQGIDKISVLRLASTYMRFREFLATVYGKKRDSSVDGFSSLLSKAIDGFILVMDKDANILFSSETITEYVGLSQQDVIGQSLFELTHADDEETITENLKPKGITPSQSRQFYVRFKSTVSPGRVQFSRSTSHIYVRNYWTTLRQGLKMVQVSGHLKLHAPKVLGLVAECQLIESSSSILEISIPQSYFTTTSSLDLKILSVDTSVKELVGFEPDDFIGTMLRDYFHPADYVSLIPCKNLLYHTGHAVSPVFRFMTSSGEWVWVQIDGLVRYKQGTNEPQYLETKCKVISSFEGKFKYIEQKELYAATHEVDPSLQNAVHRDAYFLDQLPSKPIAQKPEPVVKALERAKLSSEAVDSVLHSRELGFQQLPSNLKRLGSPVPESSPAPSDSSTTTGSSPAPSDSSTTTESSPAPSDSSTTTGTSSPPTSVSNTKSDPQISKQDSTESISSVRTDLCTGQAVFSPPSANSFDQTASPEGQSITSPSSVFTVQSPDSGISCSASSPPSAAELNHCPFSNGGSVSSNGGSVSSTEAANGWEPAFVVSPENHSWAPAENSVLFPQIPQNTALFPPLPQRSTTTPQSFPATAGLYTQQQSTGYHLSDSASPMNTDMPLSSTMTSNGPDSDLLLEQLLCEAVVLNSSPETSQLHPQYQSSLLLPNGAPQAHTAGGYIPVPAGSNGVGGASVSFPANAAANSTEVQDILKQFL